MRRPRWRSAAPPRVAGSSRRASSTGQHLVVAGHDDAVVVAEQQVARPDLDAADRERHLDDGHGSGRAGGRRDAAGVHREVEAGERTTVPAAPVDHDPGHAAAQRLGGEQLPGHGVLVVARPPRGRRPARPAAARPAWASGRRGRRWSARDRPCAGPGGWGAGWSAGCAAGRHRRRPARSSRSWPVARGAGRRRRCVDMPRTLVGSALLAVMPELAAPMRPEPVEGPVYCRRWVAAAMAARIRLLIMGLRSRSTHLGGRHSGSPSGLIRQSQPRARKLWWWYRQSRVRLSRSVVPPSAQAMTWWRSHHSGAVSQPGNEQPRSRAIRAAVWPGRSDPPHPPEPQRHPAAGDRGPVDLGLVGQRRAPCWWGSGCRRR